MGIFDVMKKILAFAGSNSSKSINASLVGVITKEISTAVVTTISLTDYPLPIFGEDLEKELGYPENLKTLLELIKAHDGLIISVNEHNGSVSAFFKNVLDWLSRIEYKFLADKKVLLFSASPGRRGAISAMEYTKGVLPRYDAEVFDSMTFPSFKDNFSEEDQKVTNAEMAEMIRQKVSAFLDAV